MKRTPRENLKSFSWIYIIVIAFYVVSTIICFAMPEVSESLKNGLGNDWQILFGTSAGVVVLFNLFYFWLARRVAAGKSKGTFYMILLILGVASSLVTFFTTKGASKALSFDAIVDLIGLYYLLQVRKEK